MTLGRSVLIYNSSRSKVQVRRKTCKEGEEMKWKVSPLVKGER